MNWTREIVPLLMVIEKTLKREKKNIAFFWIPRLSCFFKGNVFVYALYDNGDFESIQYI